MILGKKLSDEGTWLIIPAKIDSNGIEIFVKNMPKNVT